MTALLRPSIVRPDDSRMRVVLVLLWAVTAAAATGSLSARGAPRSVLLLPLGAAVCIALGVLALRRFELFVLAVLVARASLDAGKLVPKGSSPAGTAGK